MPGVFYMSISDASNMFGPAACPFSQRICKFTSQYALFDNMHMRPHAHQACLGIRQGLEIVLAQPGAGDSSAQQTLL